MASDAPDVTVVAPSRDFTKNLSRRSQARISTLSSLIDFLSSNKKSVNDRDGH